MAKYYFILFLVAGAALYYIFLQDPCNAILRTDFTAKYPSYEILDTLAGEGSPDSVSCHIYYSKPDSEQVYEDTWLYGKSGDGWKFSRVFGPGEKEYVP